jgi:hypothetical protein
MKAEEKKVPEVLFLHQAEINRKLQLHLDWHETFIKYIEENNVELYKKGAKYTDDLLKQ